MITFLAVTKTEENSAQEWRIVDRIALPGDDQHRAIKTGPPVGYSWSQAKKDPLGGLLALPRSGHARRLSCASGVSVEGLQAATFEAHPDPIRHGRDSFGRPGVEFPCGHLDAIDLPKMGLSFATAREIVHDALPTRAERLPSELSQRLALVAPRPDTPS